MIWRAIRVAGRLAAAAFFRRIEVERLDSVPESTPVLLVPNHNNAFVDAVIVAAVLRRRVTLTAKSTLRGNAALRLLLRAAGVIPFHRRQDRNLGADPARNKESLARCREVLAAGGAVCIFPEGVSHSDAHLRPFRTGAARIALDFAEEKPGPLLVVPVGLHYEQKERFRSAVWVRFGEPIDARAWRATNPESGARELSAQIERAVHAVTLNFERRRDALLLSWTAELLATRGLPPPVLGRESGALAQKVALAALLRDGYARLGESRQREIADLSARIRIYHAELKQRGITPAEVYLEMDAPRAALFVVRELELLVVGLPLALMGVVLHSPAYALVRAIARRFSTDRDHWGTFVVVPGMIAVPFLWSIELFAAWKWVRWPFAAAFTALLPYAGYYALLYGDRAGSVLRRSRTFLHFLFHPDERRRLEEEGRAIIEAIERLGEAASA